LRNPELGARGICGNCKNALFSAWPITITAANFDAHASRSDLPVILDFWAS
jgi:thioredoxin 2